MESELYVVVLPILTAIVGWVASWFVERKKVVAAKMDAEVKLIQVNADLTAEKTKILYEQWKYDNIVSFFTPSALYEHTSKEIVDLLPEECKVCADITVDWIDHLLGTGACKKIDEIYAEGVYTFALVSCDMGVIVDCGGVILASNKNTIVKYAEKINTAVYEVI